MAVVAARMRSLPVFRKWSLYLFSPKVFTLTYLWKAVAFVVFGEAVLVLWTQLVLWAEVAQVVPSSPPLC